MLFENNTLPALLVPGLKLTPNPGRGLGLASDAASQRRTYPELGLTCPPCQLGRHQGCTCFEARS